MNNIAGFMQNLNNLKRTFNGDPNKYIQQMLNSGKVTQEQYNQAVQRAAQIKKMLGIQS